MNTHSLACCCLVLTFTTSFSTIPSNAKQTPPSSDIFKIHHVWHQVLQRESTTQEFITPHDHSLTSLPIVLAAIFCFIASSIASAGGLGGGGLFIPILTIVAKLDLKTASSLSSFMVTGGSIANVLCNLCRSCEFGGKSLIDYDIALCSEPCMLLGVSFGVICNRVFPEWLITLLFAIFLVWSLRLKLPWMKLGALLLVWLSFFSLYFLQGNGYGQVRNFFPLHLPLCLF